METLVAPLDHPAIARVLPHRHPFLLVDRITELEPGRRAVGVKNVTGEERYLVGTAAGARVLSSAILMEAVAQVGAVLVRARPENRGRLVFFLGIERARFRRPVVVGDVVVLEAVVRRLGPRMGTFAGAARVAGRIAAEGVMSFALGPGGEADYRQG